MRVVLDTNVLVAAFIAHGTCNEVLEAAVRNHELVISDHILREFEDCLRNKLKYAPGEVDEAVSLISGYTVTVAPAEILDETGADAEDVPVLGTAVSGSCHCLVTGDKKLLEIGTIQGIPIIRPTQFWGFEDRELQAKL